MSKDPVDPLAAEAAALEAVRARVEEGGVAVVMDRHKRLRSVEITEAGEGLEKQLAEVINRARFEVELALSRCLLGEAAGERLSSLMPGLRPELARTTDRWAAESTWDPRFSPLSAGLRGLEKGRGIGLDTLAVRVGLPLEVVEDLWDGVYMTEPAYQVGFGYDLLSPFARAYRVSCMAFRRHAEKFTSQWVRRLGASLRRRVPGLYGGRRVEHPPELRLGAILGGPVGTVDNTPAIAAAARSMTELKLDLGREQVFHKTGHPAATGLPAMDFENDPPGYGPLIGLNGEVLSREDLEKDDFHRLLRIDRAASIGIGPTPEEVEWVRELLCYAEVRVG